MKRARKARAAEEPVTDGPSSARGQRATVQGAGTAAGPGQPPRGREGVSAKARAEAGEVGVGLKPWVRVRQRQPRGSWSRVLPPLP